MKISRSVRHLYDEQYLVNKLLASRVQQIFESRKSSGWFFISRIKELESFAQKLETGRVLDPMRMEDFFACTLVVENRTSIVQAVALVESLCEIVERRPRNEGKTHKSPDAFPFDDLRLYVKLKASDVLPASPLDELVFEVQIKTFLQHAWGIATHDLVYKGSSVHWGRARVAYQIKAMLEHAEVSVEQVDFMADSSVLAVSDAKTREQEKLIKWFKETWEEDLLPRNLVRLADTVIELIRGMKFNIDVVIDCVRLDTARGEGSLLRNLSPYAVIIRSLYNNQRMKFLAYLKMPSEKGIRLFLADDPEMALAFKDAAVDKFIYLDDSTLSK